MKIIERGLEELRKTLFITKVFNSFADSLIVFLFFFALLLLFKLPWYLSLIPFLLHFFFIFLRKVRDLRYRDVEQRAPFLRERLRTVADNLSKENVIVDALNKEVLHDMKQVRVSSFIDSRADFVKLFSLGGLAVAIVLIASLNVVLFDVERVLEDISKRSETGRININGIIDYFSDGDEDIYGEESIAPLGDESLNLGVNTVEGELDLTRRKEAERINFASSYPGDVVASSDASFDEQIPEEYHDAIKKYFNQISQ